VNLQSIPAGFSKLVFIGKNSSEKELETNLLQLLVKEDKP